MLYHEWRRILTWLTIQNNKLLNYNQLHPLKITKKKQTKKNDIKNIILTIIKPENEIYTLTDKLYIMKHINKQTLAAHHTLGICGKVSWICIYW